MAMRASVPNSTPITIPAIWPVEYDAPEVFATASNGSLARVGVTLARAVLVAVPTGFRDGDGVSDKLTVVSTVTSADATIDESIVTTAESYSETDANTVAPVDVATEVGTAWLVDGLVLTEGVTVVETLDVKDVLLVRVGVLDLLALDGVRLGVRVLVGVLERVLDAADASCVHAAMINSNNTTAVAKRVAISSRSTQ
jgi:hypothetical protein